MLVKLPSRLSNKGGKKCAKMILSTHCTAQESKLLQMLIISSLILRGFHLPSSFKCRKECISSEATISHLPCYPRIGSEARESIAYLKISDEAALKCLTSNTFFFFFF